MRLGTRVARYHWSASSMKPSRSATIESHLVLATTCLINDFA